MSYLLSLLGFFVCLVVPNSVIITYPFTVFTDNQNMYYIFFKLYESAQFWFNMLLSAVAALLPDIAIKCIEHLEEISVHKMFLQDHLFKKVASADELERTLKKLSLPSTPQSADDTKLFQLVKPNKDTMALDELNRIVSSSNHSIKTIQSYEATPNTNNKLRIKSSKVVPFNDDSLASFKSTTSTSLPDNNDSSTNNTNNISINKLKNQSLDEMNVEEIHDFLEPVHDATSASYV